MIILLVGRYAAVDSKNTSLEPLRTDINISVSSLEEKNPDVIPQSNSEDEHLEEERAFERLTSAPTRTYLRMDPPNLMDMGNGRPWNTLRPTVRTYKVVSKRMRKSHSLRHYVKGNFQ